MAILVMILATVFSIAVVTHDHKEATNTCASPVVSEDSSPVSPSTP